MPRYAHVQLRWSEQAQAYRLFMGDQASTQALTSEWLEQVASFAFHSRLGVNYTVRKQKVQRGGSYWYGYRRLHGRVVKRYLGRTADLTLARLEEIAGSLEKGVDPQRPAFRSLQELDPLYAVSGVAEVGNAQRAASAGGEILLLSKLSPPRLPALLLDRPRLFGRLDAGRDGPLSLLCAPAGFGKTTLVRRWIETQSASPVAWVSLEASDNDPVRFWRYLIAACRAFSPDLAQVHSTLAATAPQPPFLPSSLEAVLTALLNALAQSPSGILVLDDYHVVTEQVIHETISFFLSHLPTTFHLVLITRTDPPFSLARLRAQNLLCEIRMAELEFSQEETAALLQQSLLVPLADETVQRIHAHLEGWGAGLHFIKLALQRSAKPLEEEQIVALPSRASLQEYFVNEVLHFPPEPIQQFLLQTSIVARLTSSLCDTITGQHHGQEMLTLLERAQLFLELLNTVALHQPQWYRYHTLFADAMRNEADRRLGKEYMRQLSLRASRWYEAHGYLEDAIDVALNAQDYLRVAGLIEQFIEVHVLPGGIQEPHTLHRWLKRLPEAILGQYPLLCLRYASTVLFLNISWSPITVTTDSIEKLLHSAEYGFRMKKNQLKLGELFAFRSLFALRQGDMPGAMRAARQALDCFGQTQHIWRGLSLCIVAEEWIEGGDFHQARSALLEAYALCEALENHYFKRVAMVKLARVFFELGEIQRASSLYSQALALVKGEEHVYVLCNALSGLAALAYEGNELERACQYLGEAISVSQSHQLVPYEVHAGLILARVQQAQGQVFVAQQQLATLLRKLPISSYLSQAVQAGQARLALALDDHMAVQRWATGRSPQPDFAQEKEDELLVSRWLRIQGKLEEASRQLEPLFVEAHEAGHGRLLHEIQIEMALIAMAKKDKGEAQRLAREVLRQAFAGNFVRLFLDAGEPMATLLRSLLPHVQEQPLRAYIRSILKAFPVQPDDSAQAQFLVEPLSPQEMRVLRLLVQHRSNVEIADALVVSVNTVRTQVQSIYSKLGVHTRSAASEVAHELQLIS